ncbi:class I SAM-dependent methyltransferase [Marivirga sp. S37H4]|uniref:Class I SAM-dependent methyltransferase n=1 Tax=Marivirga aurantiaca TaxID=2802615 RepID=A0A934WZF1_9BACT|nr:class I SAM-dependent methyltransferase [Marivirga aurantiaca]MBK6265834.1 class I SAM-dependent methyltransferase [Marivirga aurantiaca]
MKKDILTHICRLCNNSGTVFSQSKKKLFYQCPICSGIFADSAYLPTDKTEIERYESHNNDTSDPRYRNFVSPITNAIETNFTLDHSGLDFGSGTGPVITEVLTEKGYNIKPYDPYFDNHPELLKQKYDFIACCEVIEHFHQPAKEFQQLRNLLKKGGKLFIMTDPYKEGIDFLNWYYKNDPTHVFFYKKETFHWIRDQYNFSDCTIAGRLIVFSD